MTEQKQHYIDTFVNEIVLTEEFFDTVLDTLSEEIDLEDKDVESIVDQQQDLYHSALSEELSKFLDTNFTEQEMQSLLEDENDSIVSKFDSLSSSFYGIIEKATASFVDQVVQQITFACESEGDSCCH